jgi:two-component system response regulator HydG
MVPCPDTILIVDDAADTREVLTRNLEAQGYEVVAASDVTSALGVLEARAIGVVVTDLKMPGISGMELVRHVRENLPDTVPLMITGYPSVEGAVQAIKLGAEDFLPKPFTDVELLRAVRGAFDKLSARRALQRSEPPLKLGLVGECEPMRRVLRAIRAAAAVDSPVLLVGEVGTGKELAARTLHYSGRRGAGPFVSVHLGSIPPEQALAELFGAAEPADDAPRGLWGAALQGTLFLEGLDVAGPDVQVALVQRLQDGVGPGPRVVAAATGPLRALVRRGTFREDLMHALTAGEIDLPPLRERGHDTVLLVRHFAERTAARTGRPVARISDQALQALRAYSWPGNVAELQSVVERLTTGSDGPDVTDLPALMRFSALREPQLQTLEDVERAHIHRVLTAVDGNRSRAAEILAIDRKTLREKMKRAALTLGAEAEEP